MAVQRRFCFHQRPILAEARHEGGLAVLWVVADPAVAAEVLEAGGEVVADHEIVGPERGRRLAYRRRPLLCFFGVRDAAGLVMDAGRDQEEFHQPQTRLAVGGECGGMPREDVDARLQRARHSVSDRIGHWLSTGIPG